MLPRAVGGYAAKGLDFRIARKVASAAPHEY